MKVENVPTHGLLWLYRECEPGLSHHWSAKHKIMKCHEILWSADDEVEMRTMRRWLAKYAYRVHTMAVWNHQPYQSRAAPPNHEAQDVEKACEVHGTNEFDDAETK